MASAFNLTAQLNLRGPNNVNKIVSDIRRQLGTIKGNIDFKIDASAARNVGQLNATIKTLNATLAETNINATNAARAIATFTRSASAISSASSSTANNIAKASAATGKIATSARSASKDLSIARTELEEFGRQGALAVRRFAAFTTVTTTIFSLTNAFKQAFGAFVEFDKAFVKLQQVTDKSGSELKNLSNEITSLSVGLGVASSDLIDVAQTLAQAGLSARDTEKALRALALSDLAPSFDKMNDTVEGSIALMRQFGISAGDLEKALGSINAVAAGFAVEASDIIAAIQRTGGVFASASKGVSEGTDALNEFIAVFTSVRATTRESAETIATGLRTIFTRIQRESTIEALREFGVTLTDLDGKFVGAYKAIQLISEGLNRIDPRDIRFSQIVEELGGFRQIGKVIPLIQQFATAQQALKVAQTGQGSLANDAIKAQLSLANQISKVREEFLAFVRDIGSSDTFQTLAKTTIGFASGLIKVASALRGVLPVLAILGIAKGGSALTQFGSGFISGIKKVKDEKPNQTVASSAGSRIGSFVGGVSSGADTSGLNTTLKQSIIAIESLSSTIISLTNSLDVINSFSSEISNNTASLVANTSSIDALTNAVLSLNLGGSGATLNKGGKVAAFARGGVVPGSGNSDTVPAMLMPGEFVIRKKAVEKLGTDNLHKINKYAQGGAVVIRDRANTDDTSILDEGLKNIVNKTSRQFGKKGRPTNINPKKFGGYQSIKGNIFEEALRLSGASDSQSAPNADWDYDPWQGNSAFTKLNSVVIADAKVSEKSASRAEFGKKISNFRRKNPGSRIKNFGAAIFEDESSRGDPTDYTYTEEDLKQYNLGGLIQKFSIGGTVEEIAKQKNISIQNALLDAIQQLGGIKGVKSISQVSSANRDLDSILRANIIKIRTEDQNKSAIDAVNKALQRRTQNLRQQVEDVTSKTSAGLSFGAAAMFGTPYTNAKKTISQGLKESVDVLITGRTLDQKVAKSLDRKLSSSFDRSSSIAAKKVMISSIIQDITGGSELGLDFDRTLAFGADKILSDPKQPKFSEFADRDKVAAALKGARLSNLGRSLVKLVQKQDIGQELLSKMFVITARPPSTVDLIQSWLSSQGLPIKKFVGVGGEGVSASQVAKLKAELLPEGSSFVDDDERNISEAANKSGIKTYLYKAGSSRKQRDLGGEATAKGILFEKMITDLGGPPASSDKKSIDYPNGLGRAAQYFQGLIPTIPTDAKRTLSGPSDLIDNITNYLKARGFNIGGLVKFAGGGKASRKVDFERGVGPSPFATAKIKKLGPEIYDLEKDSGLSKFEFNDVVNFARTNDFNLEEFKKYLQERIAQKKAKSNLMMNPIDVLRAMTPDSSYVSQKQRDLARSLMGAPDAQYNPKYDNARSQKFEDGGAAEDTVPALLTPGEFVINKKAAKKIGYSKLEKMNKADKLQGYNKGGSVGYVQRFADGGIPKLRDNVAPEALTDLEKAAKASSQTLLEYSRDIGNIFSSLQNAFKNQGYSDAQARGLAINEAAAQRAVSQGRDSATVDDQTFMASILRAVETIQKNAEQQNNKTKESRDLKASSRTSSADRSVDESRRKALKEAYAAQERGKTGAIPATRKEYFAAGIERSDFDRNSGSSKTRTQSATDSLDKFMQVQTVSIAKEVKAKWDALYNEERTSLKSFYEERMKNAKTPEEKSQIKDEYQQAKSSLKDEYSSRAQTELEARKTEAENSARQYRSDSLEGMVANRGPLTDLPKSNAESEAAAKEAAKAQVAVAESLNLIKLRSKEAGVSVSAYTNSLRQQIIETAKAKQKQSVQNVENLRLDTISKRASLQDSGPAGQQAAKEIRESLQAAIGNSVDSTTFDKIASQYINGLSDMTKTTEEVVNSIPGLSDALKNSTTNQKAYEQTLKSLSEATGISEEKLKELADTTDIANSRSMEIYGQSAQRISSYSTKIGLALSGLGTAASDAIKGLSGSDSRSGAISAAGLSAFGTTAGTTIALLGQIPTAVESTIGSLSKMGGGVGKLASTFGPKLMSVLTNPYTAAAAVIGAAALGVAAAFKDAHNAAREFDKALAAKNVENAMERVSQAFDDFEKDIKRLDLLDTIKKDLVTAGANVAEGIRIDAEVPKAFWVNLFDALGGGAEAAQRSQILEKQGTVGYLRSSSLFVGEEAANRNRSNYIADMAPDMAKQQSASFKPVADATLRLFENKLKTGTNISDITKELENAMGAPTQLAENIARANPLIQEQLLRIEASTNLSDKEKATLQQNIIAQEALYRTTVALENKLREIEFESLQDSISRFVVSLQRMYENMDRAINKTSFELDRMSKALDLSNAALSGGAKAGSTDLQSINILRNRNAYSNTDQQSAIDLASGLFGSQRETMTSMLQIAPKMENTVLSAINKSLKENPKSSDERLAASVRSSLDRALNDIGLPPELTNKMSDQVQKAFADLRKSGDKDIGFDELAEKVPALSKQIESARAAEEIAIKALEFWQKNVNDYAEAMNQSVEYQYQANQSLRKARDIEIKGRMDLAQAFGRSISLASQQNNANANIRSLTGGATNPASIRENLLSLNATRASQQSGADSAAQRGPSGRDEFILMQKRLKDTNLALRENYEALNALANSGDMASAALAKINEIQAKTQAGTNIIEKLVTSSPEEINKFNKSLANLSNNMRGTTNNSTAEERNASLQTFNMIAPLLGDGAQQNALKANVLESMLIESGIGIDNMMGQVLDSLRNPENNDEIQAALKYYNDSINTQTAATTALGEIQKLMADNTAEVAATKLAKSIEGVKLNFESQQLKDINTNITGLRDDLKRAPAAPAKATGGLIYAAQGQMVNFQPKGTDTVPAMLTPGEFVVNRSATAKNLPLLKSINNGYQNGGKVHYYNDGGLVIGGTWSKRKTDEDSKSRGSIELATKPLYPAFSKDDREFVGDSASNITSALRSYGIVFGSRLKNIYSLPDEWYATASTNKEIDYHSENSQFDNMRFNALPGIGYDKVILEEKTTGGRAYTLAYNTAMTAGVIAGAAVAGAVAAPIALGGGAIAGISAGTIGATTGAAGAATGAGIGLTAQQIVGDAGYGSPPEFIYRDGSKSPKPVIATELGSLLDLKGFQSIYGGDTTRIPKKRVKAEEIKNLIPAYKAMISIIDKENFKKIQSDYSDRNQSKTDPTFKPSVDEIGGNLILSGLSQQGSNPDMLTTNPNILKANTLDVGSILGLGQTFSGGPKILAGGKKMREYGGGFDGSRFIRPYKAVSTIDDSILKMISTTSMIKEDLIQGIKDLEGEKEFTESDQSRNIKNYLSQLEALYNKNIFKATFSKDYPFDKEGIDYPITLFNIDKQKWQDKNDTIGRIINQFNNDNKNSGIKFSFKDEDFIPVESRKGGEKRLFPWVSSSLETELQNALNVKQQAFDTNEKIKVISSTQNTFKGTDKYSGLFDIPYSKVKGKVYNSISRSFVGDTQDYIVIDAQQALSESNITNPFSDIPQNSRLYFKTEKDLQDTVQKNTPIFNLATNSLENVPNPYSYTVKTLPDLNKLSDDVKKNISSLVGDNEYKVVIPSDNNTIPLEDLSFTAESFKKNREKLMSDRRLARAKTIVSTKAQESQELKEDEAFTEAKRVTLARAAWKYLNSGAVDPRIAIRLTRSRLGSEGPESLSQVATPSIEANQDAQELSLSAGGRGGEQYAKLMAWSNLFGSLYRGKSGAYFNRMGLSLNKNLFKGPEPTGSADIETMDFGDEREINNRRKLGVKTKYYKTYDNKNLNDVFKNLILRETASARSSNISMTEQESSALTKSFTDGEFADVNEKGIRTIKQQSPEIKTYADLAKVALAPPTEYIPKNWIFRQNQLNLLRRYYEQSKDNEDKLTFPREYSQALNPPTISNIEFPKFDFANLQKLIEENKLAEANQSIIALLNNGISLNIPDQVNNLRDIYKLYDSFINTSDSIDDNTIKNLIISPAEDLLSAFPFLNKIPLMSINQSIFDSYKLFKTKFKELPKVFSKAQTFANDQTGAFNLLTGGSVKFPDSNWIRSWLITRSEKLNEIKTNENKQKTTNEPQYAATGGLIYASRGSLVHMAPRGTDTVPAMLTPGEFVINRDSTNKYRPILEAINNGYYNRGGIAQYLNKGGITFPNYYAEAGAVAGRNASFDFASFMQNIANKLISTIPNAIITGLEKAQTTQQNNPNGVSSIDADVLDKLNTFTNRLKSVADTLANLNSIPSQINVTGKHDLNVIINGDSALNSLKPELKQLVINGIKHGLQKLIEKNRPGVPTDELIMPSDNDLNF